MLRCTQAGCRWVAIAPSEEAAREEYERHIREEHVTSVDADIPDGMVQVKVDDEWTTMTPEEARSLHDDCSDDD